MHYFIEYLLYYLGRSYLLFSWIVTASVRRSFPLSLIWVRNSTYFGYCLFGVSDIDVTLVSREPMPILDFIRKMKTILKMIGEINVYHPDYLESIERQANLFELDRDPNLKRYLSYKMIEVKVLKAQAIVFYLRMLDSDFRHLEKRSWLRKRKWHHHWEMVKNYLDDATVARMSSKVPVKFCKPHQWINEHYDQVSLVNLSQEITRQEEDIIAIFVEQLAWELCGVWTQKEVLCHSQIKQHFLNLKMLLIQLCLKHNPRALSLTKDINLLLDFFDKK